MPKFEDFIKGFKYDPATFNADEFTAALTAAHNEDVGLWEAKVKGTDETIATLNKTVDDQKIALWDFYMKSGKPIDPKNASGSQIAADADEDPNEYVPKGIDSLFGKAE